MDAYEVRFRSITELAEAFATDLAQHRLFVRGAHHTRLGDDISIRMVLPETQSVLTLTGLVLEHVKDDRRGEGALVVLLDLLDDTVALIDLFISERLDVSQPDRDPPSLDQPLDVLVVGGEPFVTQATRAFRRDGDRVRFATDGFEALAAAIRRKPDVIFSDVVMPRMDGWQFLRMVRSNERLAAVPVVFTSELASERERLRGYQLGVDDYLSRTCRPSELRSCADRLVRRAHTIAPEPRKRTAIRGELSRVSLAALLSLLELEQRSGSIAVNGSISGALWIGNGRVLDAQVSKPMMERHSTSFEHALTLLSATDGEFVFTAGAAREQCALDVSISELVAEHARLLAELAQRKTS